MNDTEAIIATAKEAVEPYEVTHGLYLTHDDETGTRVIDVRKELHEDPVRTWKSGTVTVDDADSFIGYMAKHAEPRSELWASPTEGTITAVIDAPGGGKDEGDRGGHRATLQLTFTDDWKDWAGVSGKMLTQVELAEFIESHLATFVTPAGAVMLELAQSFQATSRVNFQSSRRLANGEAELEYTEVIDAKAGRKGSIPIPVTLELALRPFEGEPVFKASARFRYRITDGQLLVGIHLDRPRDVLRAAFDQVTGRVETQLSVTVWTGSPQ